MKTQGDPAIDGGYVKAFKKYQAACDELNKAREDLLYPLRPMPRRMQRARLKRRRDAAAADAARRWVTLTAEQQAEATRILALTDGQLKEAQR